jgi:hypothetical protein
MLRRWSRNCAKVACWPALKEPLVDVAAPRASMLRADYIIVISLWPRDRNAEQIMAIQMKSFPVGSLGCGMTGGPNRVRTAVSDGIERRDFIQGVGLLAGVAAATALTEQPSFAQAAAHTGTKPMSYEAKPLSLDPKTIKGISEKVLVSHYENNYVGAVKRLNAIGGQLESSISPRRRPSWSTGSSVKS